MNTKAAILMSVLTGTVALIGCGDRTVILPNEHRTEYEVKDNGVKRSTKEVTVRENADGTVTKTETKTETRPDGRHFDDRKKDDVIVKLPGIEIKKD